MHADRSTRNLVVVLLLATGLNAQQQNSSAASMTINGQVANLVDPVGHEVHVCASGSLTIAVTSSQPYAGVTVVCGQFAPGTLPTALGILDLANFQIFIDGNFLFPTGNPLEPFFRTDGGNPALGTRSTLLVTSTIPAGLIGAPPFGIQCLVSTAGGPQPFRLTEAAVIVVDNPPPVGQEWSPATSPYDPPPSECDPWAGTWSLGENKYSDPVHLFSGELYESAVDLRVKGRGMDFVWHRDYRSKSGPDTEMGVGWDHSYNLKIYASGPHLVLAAGMTRRDTFVHQPDGTWNRSEFFRELRQNPNGTYTLTLPDKEAWNFRPLDGSPAAGKISTIVDRNNNSMTFAYDGQGRLSTITDTLSRVYSVGYNAAGRIALVREFTNREVTYTYYTPGESGGSVGDLKSVTTPAVTGTPNGNDFPAGKTTVYTYTTGFADPRLNHNLLTKTDPKGQVFVQSEYDPTTNPSDVNFDRLKRQRWGNTGDIIDLVYVPQTPTPANTWSVMKVIVNDREGKVKECDYDGNNRGVILREYTGRADPDLPTTATTNRPGSFAPKLRSADPDYFETRFEYNAQSLKVRAIHPNGNIEVFTYDDANPDPRSRGNLLKRRLIPGPLGGDQSEIVETFEYDTGLGGCCGTNFVTRHVDGRGNETRHTYSVPEGNRTQTVHRIPSIIVNWEYNSHGQTTAQIHPANGSGHRRRDEFTYYTAPPQLGYLHEQKVDAGGFNLTTTYEYNDVGVPTRIIDPRGNDSLFIVNQRDQIVRTLSRPVDLTDVPVRYALDIWYDANDNVGRTDVENRDEHGTILVNSHFTTVFEYEILNRLVRQCQEFGNFTGAIPGTSQLPSCSGLPSSAFITIEHDYDANRNHILIRSGEATAGGSQPTNVVQSVYDERDLLFSDTRGAGSANPSTTQYDYDGNGNLKRRLQGIQSSPRIWNWIHDGYARMTSAIDPMGNVASSHYDANGNVVSTRVDGEWQNDLPGSGSNVRLAESTYLYDAMDRGTRTDMAHFDTASQLSIGDGLSTSQTVWSGNSQVIQTIDDRNNSTSTLFDTANRPSVTTDARGNTLAYSYDANSNVISLTENDVSDVAGAPNQVFVTTYAYDGLNRLIQEAKSPSTVNNVTAFRYDSRSNPTLTIDALSRETRREFDGLSRMLRTIRDMNSLGASASDPADIVITQAWDRASRLVSQTDDNGQATTYTYDSLDRQTRTTYADLSVRDVTYDVHDNEVIIVDPNQTTAASTFDLLDRLTLRNSPTVGPNVIQGQDEFTYDGLSRLRMAQTGGSDVERRYDSLSNVTQERQHHHTPGIPPLNAQLNVTCDYDGMGNMTRCVYPGGFTVNRAYDALNRVRTISPTSGAPFATYDYIGPDRVHRRTFGNGTQTDDVYDGFNGATPAANDSGVKRLIGTRHTITGTGAVIDDRTYTWNRVYDKTERKDIRAGGPGFTSNYQYDPADRLTRTTITNPSLTIVRDTQYTLDGAGNRTLVTGGLNPGSYSGDATNFYLTTPIGVQERDDNGNTTRINPPTPSSNRFWYDWKDELRQYQDQQADDTFYNYDALGRRIVKELPSGGPAGVVHYFYHGWQILSVANENGVINTYYVYGPYIDEVLMVRRAGQDYYYHTDDMYSVMAITNSSGAVAERYDYGDFGQPLNATTLAAVSGNPSLIGNPFMFTGREFDSESDMYHYRTRHLDPRAGRFLSRDAMRVWGDRLNIGNAYTYVGNNPPTKVDPLGLQAASGGVAVGGDFGAFWGMEFVGSASWTSEGMNCYSVTICERWGAMATAGVGVGVTGSVGTAPSTGVSSSSGFGVDIPAGGVSGESGGGMYSGTVLVGPGVGGGFTLRNCKTYTYCFNPSSPVLSMMDAWDLVARRGDYGDGGPGVPGGGSGSGCGGNCCYTYECNDNFVSRFVPGEVTEWGPSSWGRWEHSQDTWKEQHTWVCGTAPEYMNKGKCKRVAERSGRCPKEGR